MLKNMCLPEEITLRHCCSLVSYLPSRIIGIVVFSTSLQRCGCMGSFLDVVKEYHNSNARCWQITNYICFLPSSSNVIMKSLPR